jgi:hypothetical protein
MSADQLQKLRAEALRRFFCAESYRFINAYTVVTPMVVERLHGNPTVKGILQRSLHEFSRDGGTPILSGGSDLLLGNGKHFGLS